MLRFLLLLLLTASVQAHPIHLEDICSPTEYQYLQQQFPTLDLAEVTLALVPCDGEGETLAYVKVFALKPSTVINLDMDDFEGVPMTPGVMQVRLMRSIIVHELAHIEQSHRGIEYRQQALADMEIYSYRDQPCEKEAYDRAAEVVKDWPSE